MEPGQEDRRAAASVYPLYEVVIVFLVGSLLIAVALLGYVIYNAMNGFKNK